MNNTYLSLFSHFDKFFNNYKSNLLLNNFNNSQDIEKQTKILFELFKISKKKDEEIIIPKAINSKKAYSIKDGIFDKINNYYYFQYNAGKLKIITFDENRLIYKPNLSPEFNEKIYSVSISKENNQIYACLSNEKRVKIFDYNLKHVGIWINDQEIKLENNSPSHFNKCIYIGNANFATADNDAIRIWHQRENGNIEIVVTHSINQKTSDLFLANKDYFISVQPKNKKLIIFDVNNLNPQKTLTNIDSQISKDCLLKYQEYIIINCEKGFALFSINSKQIVQYIENYIGISLDKKIFLDNKDNLSILNIKEINNKYIISIIKLSMKDGLLEPFENYQTIKIKENVIKKISLINKDLILCEENVYSLKEEELSD